ncbi:hypothetical protein CF319_g7489 [Tilletia indica]|nr:hypothetical protein CF319_g7489 [Tilletia indica]
MQDSREDYEFEPAKKKFKCIPCTKFDLPTFVEQRHIKTHNNTRKHQCHKARAEERMPLRAQPLPAEDEDDDGGPAIDDDDLDDELLLSVPVAVREEERMWEMAERSDDEIVDQLMEEQDQANEGFDELLRSAWDGLDAFLHDDPTGWFPFAEKKTLFGVFFWLSPRFAISKAVLNFSFKIAEAFRGQPPSIHGYFSSSSDEGERQLLRTNPLKVQAAGKKAISVPVALFVDDLSGNTSKRWNKHEAIYLSNLCLDRSSLDLDAHTHVISVSAKISATDQMAVVVDELIQLYHNPPTMYDSHFGEDVVVRPFLLLLLCDNPMAAELAGSIGLTGNLFCRLCEVDGANLKTQRGIERYLEPGPARTAPGVIAKLREQLDQAVDGVQARVNRIRVASGVKDSTCEKAILKVISIARAVSPRIARQEKDRILEGRWHGPLFRLYDVYGFDVTQSTPIEVLHSWLLGPAKYLWVTTCSTNDDGKREIAIRLSAANTSGIINSQRLNGSYLVANPGSLVGKDIKVISQVAAAAFIPLREEGVISDRLWEAWRWAAVLTRLLFVERVLVGRKESYMLDLRNALMNFYFAIASIDPQSLLKKRKFHILSHACDGIEQFGPAKGIATERYEAYNTIVRNASLCSNRSAPSKDIAQRLTDQDMLRQVMAGTQCFQEGGGEKQASSPAIQRECSSIKDGILEEHYGCKKRGGGASPGDIKRRGEDVVLHLHNGDRLRLGDSAIIAGPVMEGGISTHLVRIDNITSLEQEAPIPHPAVWINGRSNGSYVSVRPYFPVQQDDGDGMRRFELGADSRNVPVFGVNAGVNFVHDCAHHGCPIVSGPGARQEREVTQATQHSVVHTRGPRQRYVLNDGMSRESALGPVYGQIPRLHTKQQVAALAVR